MSNALAVVRPYVPASVRYVPVEVSEAIRRAAWIARDLELISPEKLDRIFSRTIELMEREDFEDLSHAMKRLAVFLAMKASSR